MKKLELTYIGMGQFSEIPIYKDQDGNYWADLNTSDPENPEYRNFKIFMDDYDDWEDALSRRKTPYDKWKNPEIEIIEDYERNPELRFNYQLLGRLKSDCDYFLGNGNGYIPRLWAGSIEGQIAEMKKLHNSFPDNKKPEWLTWEESQ